MPDDSPAVPEIDSDVEDLLAACIECVEAGERARAEALLEGSPHGARARRLLRELVGQGIVEPSDPGEAIEGDVAAPETVGRYRILRELARGGQGIVYLAEDPQLARRVAVKVLRGRLLDSESLVGRFRREATVASRLGRHPGICTVYEASVERTADGADRVPFIAMEFLDGETLALRIRASRGAGRAQVVLDGCRADASRSPGESTTIRDVRRFDDVLLVVEQVARALHAAHESGVVHRDVKPSNIVLVRDASRGPVLTDFGLAAEAERTDGEPALTRSGERFGTPEYMSPEQVACDFAGLDHRSDIWSLGVTLYECLTLRRPFEAPTTVGLYRAIESAPTPDPRTVNPAVPRDLAVVVERALEKDPERRYRTALEFAEDLRRVRERRPIHARPAGRLLRLCRWAEREPRLAISLATVLLVLAGGLVATSWLLAQRNAALVRYQQMSDASLVERLLEEERLLWPATPARLSAMETWLDAADAALGREDVHRQALASIRTTAPEGIEAERVRAWREQVLTTLLARHEPLAAARARVEERRAFARQLERVTVGDHAALWSRCAASLAADARFGVEFVLAPQLGLVPLGRDGRSRLWEFAVYGTGELPGWDGDELDGALRVSDSMAVVLVLLPPGPAGEEAFFAGKHEITQAQWLAMAGENPAYHRAGSTPPSQSVPTSPRNPVENVDWNRCVEILARRELEVPTEREWLRAARGGGGDAPWFSGDAVASLEGVANVADRAALRAGVAWECTPELDDGFIAHAPVGTFAPNGFGLHDVHGNVLEWCADRWEAPGGAAYLSESDLRVQRGGSFDRDARWARFDVPFGAPRTEAMHNVGVRAVRKVR